MASTKVSVAEARQNFARLIKRAEHGNAIEITRRGEPVAVLVSASEYAAITGERSSFIEAARQVRSRMGEAGRNTVIERFSLAYAAPRFRDILLAAGSLGSALSCLQAGEPASSLLPSCPSLQLR